MRRRHLTWIALFLLIVLGLIGVWVRSYYTVSAFAEYSPTARRWVGIARGELIYDSYTDAHFEDTSQGWRWLNYRATIVKRGAEFPRVLGFSFGRPRRQAVVEAPMPVYRHFVSIPLWFVTASGLAMLFRLWRVVVQFRKRRCAAPQSAPAGSASHAT